MELNEKTCRSRYPGQRVPTYADQFVDESVTKRLRHLVSPHVDSFNFFLSYGLQEAVADLPRIDFKLDENLYVLIHITQVEIGYPTSKHDSREVHMLPREARERGLSYAGAFYVTLSFNVSTNPEEIQINSRMGDFPIMVMSDKCHIRNLSHSQLLGVREESNEMGGFFVMNGLERVVRLLQVPRRNYASAIERTSYKNRGPLYSDKGVAMRCVRPDQSSSTITLHYLTNGSVTLRFVVRKQEFLLPVILVAKALVCISDKELFDRILQGDSKNTFIATRLEIMLRDARAYPIKSSVEACAYLGSMFRNFLPISDRTSDAHAGMMLIQRFLFVHVTDFAAKLEVLLHMMRKLYCFAQGDCEADNADALMNHEILLPGHLITMYIKEKMEEVMLNIRSAMMKDYRVNPGKAMADLESVKYFQNLSDRYGKTMANRVGTFISTGNLVSSTGLDLMQVSGYTIVAERLNYLRYMSHYQSVHRGQFFANMKTTAVRKLLPESWGFMCPVHTPDGSPCGLLNHLARYATIVTHPTSTLMPSTTTGRITPTYDALEDSGRRSESGTSGWATDHKFTCLLVALGVVIAGLGTHDGQTVLDKTYLPVLVDGVVVGGVPMKRAAEVAAQLRWLKVRGGPTVATRVDPTTEVALLFPSARSAQSQGSYPGLYIFTQPGRMLRPVRHLRSGLVEWIGPMEQVYMDIACMNEDIRGEGMLVSLWRQYLSNKLVLLHFCVFKLLRTRTRSLPRPETTHQELELSVMLSQVASLTPFSDYNQSPRNMYQCQMGKQTMGTPAHAFKSRADNKLFRIQNPQAPLVHTAAHREFQMDEYPQGANAVVAVIAYTGYDMEDAMIINKSSFERGFGYGCVYKTAVIDLDLEETKSIKSGTKPVLSFSNLQSTPHLNDHGMPTGLTAFQKIYESLDVDGIICEGEVVQHGEPLYCIHDAVSGEYRVVKHKEREKAYVDTVRIIGSGKTVHAAGTAASSSMLRRISITLRYDRKPVIGDKFSSRHGQKGTLSVLWPQADMPFSESGMSPDVLINPHAFPSRMTIGMLIESMAGKSGALHGVFQDATPFRFHEENRVVDYMGEQLRAAGYHYYGSEALYSGVSGRVMKADIFMGVVFYQRLRHMVSDKSQARSTGAVVSITRQPVKGRKKGGGIRLGEMERDALLAHGVSFCIHDRLMNCSDSHIAYVCARCGSLLSVTAKETSVDVVGQVGGGRAKTAIQQRCSTCESAGDVRPVNLPYVYRYLTNELAAMGIRLSLKLSD